MNNHGGEGTIMSTEAQPNNRLLVLFPLPFQGHINPMLQLANILHTKGFKITIIHTEFNSPNKSNYPQFTFISISDGLSKVKTETLNLDATNSVINFMNKSCIAPFKDCLTKLLEEEPVACLISDALWHFTQSVADSLKLPRVVLRTSSMSCILVYAALPALREKGYFKDTIQEEQIQDLEPMTNKDIVKIMKGEFEEGKMELIANMIKETKSASGIIWNTFKELEEPELIAISEHFGVPSFPIGPFHKYFPSSSSSLIEQDRSFVSWLDLQPVSSVVYASFGSIAQMGESEFINMAWGLANSKQRFLWVVRPGSVCGSQWLESLPKGFIEEVGDRGCIVKWAPQQEVLAHQAIGGFWTHNGWNSTLESICEGVPMISSPFWGDQPLNARYISEVTKVGVCLENGWQREAIASVIGRVMMDQVIRERAKVLKQKLDVSLIKGGSSYESLDSLAAYISSFHVTHT